MLPEQFGFAIEYVDNASNMRYHYPDFVVKLDTGEQLDVDPPPPPPVPPPPPALPPAASNETAVNRGRNMRLFMIKITFLLFCGRSRRCDHSYLDSSERAMEQESYWRRRLRQEDGPVPGEVLPQAAALFAGDYS